MSNTSSVTNKLTNKSCLTSGGKFNTTDTIYAAECTKHNLIYVGHSSQKLSARFNGHRSDVKVKPKACELSQHFHESKNCKIEKDLKVYVLQDNATGTREKREFMEDRWITRLNTKSPNGMNSNLKNFARTFYSLFQHFLSFHTFIILAFLPLSHAQHNLVPISLYFLFHPLLFTSDQLLIIYTFCTKFKITVILYLL